MLQFHPFNMLPKDRDFPERQFVIQCMTAVLNGKQYDGLLFDFQTEQDHSGEYVKLRHRRPAVRYNLCRKVVDDSVSMLFSEGRFPAVHSEDAPTVEALKLILKDAKFNQKMIEAATIGSVGSVAIHFQVIKGRVYIKPMNTQYLTPTWDPDAPDELLMVREQYKAKGADLAKAGWAIDSDDYSSSFWFVREWDAQEERYFEPRKVADIDKPEVVNKEKTIAHGLGFVPMVWVKNLPGGDDIDGASTFEQAVETSIEIDYQLSQAGRGLKYSSDPQLVIKDPSSGAQQDIVKGAANALIVSAEGDAKLLEINGKAAEAVDAYVRTLREFALESVHGNRASPDKLAVAQSGKAMELMNQSLIWLADRLRISYGEGALLSLCQMIVKASQVYALEVKGKPVGKLNEEAELSLVWNDWFDKTALDNLNDAQTLTALTAAGLLSKETAVRSIAPEYDVEDCQEELSRIGSEQDAQAKKDMEAQQASAALQPKKPEQ